VRRDPGGGQLDADTHADPKSGEFDEAEALDTGADDFLSKPFSYVVLVARLRALVRRGSGPRPAPCQVGDLRLDPPPAPATGAGWPFTSPREVDLLEVLMSRPGEVVGKQELLERVWGPDADVDPNVVEVYLGYLRRKIDRPFDRDTLRTIRGAGTCWRPTDAPVPIRPLPHHPWSPPAGRRGLGWRAEWACC